MAGKLHMEEMKGKIDFEWDDGHVLPEVINPEVEFLFRRMIEATHEKVNPRPGDKILDIGCGRATDGTAPSVRSCGGNLTIAPHLSGRAGENSLRFAPNAQARILAFIYIQSAIPVSVQIQEPLFGNSSLCLQKKYS